MFPWGSKRVPRVPKTFPIAPHCWRDFFSFFPGSQHVPFKFPMDSHQALNGFPKFPLCSPTWSPKHLTFIPYALANVVLLSPI
jgi:hypothetical protein